MQAGSIVGYYQPINWNRNISGIFASEITMSEMARKKQKQNTNWLTKLRDKYRLVILNDDNYEEQFSFRLSRLNVFVAVGFTAIVLIVGTIFLIAFTPLREYIPGYTDVTLSQKVNDLVRRADSLENVTRQKSNYIENIRRVIQGDIPVHDSVGDVQGESARDISHIQYTRSAEDSLLRQDYRRESSFDLFYQESDLFTQNNPPRTNFFFFTPLKGIVSSEFNLGSRHYGIDIVSRQNEAVIATLAGTVIFSDWTVKTGHVIGIQHAGNFISVYKHNSVLLKEQGSSVKAGEPIAIVGESGELTSGAHLHFELWYNGTPINPRDYIAF